MIKRLQDLAKINGKIREEIDANLVNINKQSQDYIKDIVILINREIGINKIFSIILFGSQRPNNDEIIESCAVSDCDLLIIFKDRVSNRHIKEIERYFIGLEIKHKFRDNTGGFFQNILGVIQQTTGMFVSHFLTKKIYWEKALFHKIFQVNKYFSYVFAPTKIVLSSVIDNSKILYGTDLRSIVQDVVHIPHFDMIKSTIMNLMISIFSIVILPLKKLEPMKYQLEAVKWALKASNYYSFEDSVSLERVIRRFKSLEKKDIFKRHANVFFNRFLNLRESPRSDIGFMLRSPLRILKIHIKGIMFNKILKALERSKI